jgi:hypothetical protein
LAYRSERLLYSVSYTLSHSTDNQSDPLKGDFFDLTFTPATQRSGFARQFDPRGDLGNSDFDQRHNLVSYFVWSPPAPRWGARWLNGWRLSSVIAFRSGFPFTVTDAVAAPVSGGHLLVRRADVLSRDRVWLADPEPVAGGARLLDAAAFCQPELCVTDRSRMGNGKRGEFFGPGFYNLDVSVSRVFAIQRISEQSRLTLRADIFNFLNHANLGQPAADLQFPETFGIALRGRRLRDIGVPSLLPLRETSRQVQLMLRLEF